MTNEQKDTASIILNYLSDNPTDQKFLKNIRMAILTDLYFDSEHQKKALTEVFHSIKLSYFDMEDNYSRVEKDEIFRYASGIFDALEQIYQAFMGTIARHQKTIHIVMETVEEVEKKFEED